MTSLSGIRVLDLSRVLAAPWCTQILGDLGADVVKVERPHSGDDTRGWGPPFLHDRDGNATRESAYFLGVNRNKRSITIDLNLGDGQQIVRDLARRADVVVENFKVGDLARYGLDYTTLSAANPQLVYCSVTGFGQTGPYRERAGYDFAIQGVGGLMSVTGERDDNPGGGPQKVGVAVSDLFTGLYAAVAILAALRHRDLHGVRSGAGQFIDLALLDVQVAMLANLGAHYLVAGIVPGRAGNAHQNIVPYQVFEVSDGHIVVAVGNDRQFTAFCRTLGHPDWAADARFSSNADRVRNRDALIPMLADIMRIRTKDDWLARLDEAKVPSGPINRLDEVFSDPQIQARGMVETMSHPLVDSLRLVSSPLNLSLTPAMTQRPPPLLGEHTEEVLADWLGWDQASIAAARQSGALGTAA
jgi:crotonobetainyl-CoA:carnitine CoA-transferase CaiB-like acyl-CoA transferase